MIRVLHSVSNMDRAGIETMLMNYYRYMDKSKVQFDFLCNKKFRGIPYCTKGTFFFTVMIPSNWVNAHPGKTDECHSRKNS